MNALKLCHDMKRRGILLSATGEHIKVSAPIGALTEEDRLALKSLKPALLRILTGPRAPVEDAPKSKARWAGPGWIEIYDPVAGEWHEIRASECLAGVVAEADRRRKGGVA